MAKFLFVFHGGGMPETQEAQDAAMAAWGAWYEGIGHGVVDAGNPVGKSHTVSSDGHVENGGANPVSGYCIIDAADHVAACDIAAKNPIVVDGSGSVEVAPLMEM